LEPKYGLETQARIGWIGHKRGLRYWTLVLLSPAGAGERARRVGNNPNPNT
jgi:hypothetical protein